MAAVLRLFDKAECPFCWKVRIALAEAGLHYDLVTFAPGDDRTELKRLSPTGTTPVLVNGDGPIWESSVIVEYINDMTSNVLLPGTRGDRARARLLHHFSDTQTGKHLREVIFEKRDRPESDWDLDRIANGEAGWRDCLDWLETVLRGRPYFSGGFSLAECALYPRFALAERYGVGVDGHHPGLLCWYKNLNDRSSCRTTKPAAWSAS